MSAREVFETCCRGIEDADRKNRLLTATEKVESAADDYSAAGESGTIQLVQAATYEPLGLAVKDDFVWLYNKRLVGSPSARSYYERIRDGNRNGRCALCNVQRALTLDHHLPKADHPVFAVSPDNLLPACRDCNSIKLQDPTPTLNAYFDDLGPGPWLKLEVIPADPWIPKFSIQVQPNWSSDLATRAQSHFDRFDLQAFYAYQANRQTAGIRDRLTGLYTSLGPEGVRRHLEGEAVTWQKGDPNSWEAALYAGLATSVWYCSGGFGLVGA
ncbi:HNH endonuclease [Mycolicibacterium fortuitum]|uniref:HNH endonuclease signature motif containing protein n=2 Tax=Mycolicibacterium fortuitum TaxID=1766 RepID=A0AAE4VIV4_MYCFO|nr:HNH endonuclease signature motif containing protein [Mycolicibacterium fortuitum]MCV7143098.1 HNH endonuclease [Mycolicibacterium fortuitum]MDV7189481.1 HNH endonuclease signature motif containing protein [Mycolicibacterium fortuitum]MDV7202482.1 HNH endonuclease signature motif containing protein [Mycolicibacterium fortuitum]MDV7230821.1 HNH endonuclease signature motif containing protein [Mycolicibacterium fortuitum]MDV7256288.1 HNH endonuclease signature motif containing protein [Mycolic